MASPLDYESDVSTRYIVNTAVIQQISSNVTRWHARCRYGRLQTPDSLENAIPLKRDHLWQSKLGDMAVGPGRVSTCQ